MLAHLSPLRNALVATLALSMTMGCGSTKPGSSSAIGSGGADSGTTTGSGGAPFVPAGHPPFPVVPPNDGSELVMPRLVVIVGPGDPLADQLFAFGDALVQSAWLAAIGHDYGIAPTAGTSSVHITGGAVAATMDYSALFAYVTTTLEANPAAAPDGHTIYLFFYPPGTSRGDDCADLGAHGAMTIAPYQKGTGVDSLAWAQRCPIPAGMTEIAGLTITASHEVAESATDAYPPHGFALPAQLWPQTETTPPWAVPSWSYLQSGGVEVADLCEGTVIDDGAFAYQRIWSTTAAAAGGDPCVPAAPAPYYSAATPRDWITVPAGSTAMVPVLGWSTGPRADWAVSVFYGDTHEGGFTPTFAGGATTTMINNGVTAMLEVTTPSTPGAFVVYELLSSEGPPDVNGYLAESTTSDWWHRWMFGIRTTCVDCTEGPDCGDGICETSKSETCATCPDDCGACGALCGPSNFTVPCGASSCPTGATCTGGTCSCPTGFTSVTCTGEACSGTSCVSPGWWCVPATCGDQNRTVPCGSGSCPSSSLCTPDLECSCAAGSVASTCDGQPCPSGGCKAGDYWCTVCGTQNSLVTCSDGTTCPSFSTCVVGTPTVCDCQSGYRDVSCAGVSCADTPCDGSDWWCVPE
jgi:hypothetical protein